MGWGWSCLGAANLLGSVVLLLAGSPAENPILFPSFGILFPGWAEMGFRRGEHPMEGEGLILWVLPGLCAGWGQAGRCALPPQLFLWLLAALMQFFSHPEAPC